MGGVARSSPVDCAPIQFTIYCTPTSFPSPLPSPLLSRCCTPSVQTNIYKLHLNQDHSQGYHCQPRPIAPALFPRRVSPALISSSVMTFSPWEIFYSRTNK